MKKTLLITTMLALVTVTGFARTEVSHDEFKALLSDFYYRTASIKNKAPDYSEAFYITILLLCTLLCTPERPCRQYVRFLLLVRLGSRLTSTVFRRCTFPRL